ncbi:hypothetical protein HG1285_02988 [Hydrogenivirga sp. 128-5-R1-1]|nr:hypothetical protein HG1285_02988 [Hydrogenivirga sp. 128-5-R1-1]
MVVPSLYVSEVVELQNYTGETCVHTLKILSEVGVATPDLLPVNKDP